MKRIVPIIMVVLGLAGNAIAQVADVGSPKMVQKFPNEFQFQGGTLGQFVSAIRKSFGVDLSVIGTVPESMLHTVQVPKLRLGGQRLEFPLVLNLYNQISTEGDPSMGRWIIKHAGGELPNVLLVESISKKEGAFAVKAFAMPVGGDRARFFVDVLRKTITEERERIALSVDTGQYPGVVLSDLRGDLRYHSDAGILVASGGKVYVDLASAIIEAFKDRPWPLTPIPEPNEAGKN